MKISIAISVLILAAAAVLGWSDQQRLTAARAGHAKLVAEAALLGITRDPAAGGDPARITKRGRADREAEARAAAVEFIAFAREMEAIEKKGGPPDEATQKRSMDFMERMMSLDAAQLKILIAELRGAKDLKDETRQGLIGFSIMTLANDHPQAALTLFTESADLFKENGMGNHVISSALTRWAKDDPLAAVEWLRANGGKFGDEVVQLAKHGVITGTAERDPRLAFQLIKDLGFEDRTDNTIENIVGTARTPEDRTAVLAAFRGHLLSFTKETDRERANNSAMGTLARGMIKEGFEAGAAWIERAKLDPTECEFFARGLHATEKTKDTGRWVEWVGETLPPDKSDGPIKTLIRQWTQNDFQAAGKWLAATPDGSTKNVSIRAYAETVSQYEPETAAQWAMTLPPGKDREETLRNIHGKWPKEDAAAREAFAKEHGIGK